MLVEDIDIVLKEETKNKIKVMEKKIDKQETTFELF